MVVKKRKKNTSRKSKDDSNESKYDHDCWLESSADKQLTEDWKLFDSELSESNSFVNSGYDEDVDMSLDNNKVSFPSQKGNAPENDTMVCPEGDLDMSLEEGEVLFPSHKGNTPQKGPIVSSEGE